MEKDLTVPQVAEAAGVSEATIHRWKNSLDNAGRLPPPIRRPGKPASWPRQVIDEWLTTFNAVRNTERALERFGSAPEVDALLRKVARYGHRLLSDTSIPLGLRKGLSDTLSKIQWDRAPGVALSGKDRSRACRLLLELMALVGSTEGSDK